MKKTGIIVIASFVFAALIVGIMASKPAPKKIIRMQKGDDYKAEWQEVVNLDNKRLPKSALEQVNKIYALAKASNNQEQVIKALFYKAKYQQILEEQSFIKAMDVFKQEADQASFPNKQIIYSIIAEQFWQYYQNNRWQINQRTHTQNYDLEDISTWDIRKIIEESTKYYMLSLENAQDLSRVSITDFPELIHLGKDDDKNTSERYRPSLYDFLGHRAIRFFENDIPNITQAAETFSIDDAKYFAVDAAFAKQKIAIEDSSNLKNYAFVLLQDLIKKHLNDTDKTALIDVDLKRLKFVKNNAQVDDKEKLYFDALNKLHKKYQKHDAVANVIYEIAKIHAENGEKYNQKEGFKYKGEKEKAIKLCYSASTNYGGSHGAKKCLSLLDNLKGKSLSIQSESFISSNKKSKVLVNYKNIDKAYFKLIKVDFKTLEKWLSTTNYNNRNEFIRNKFEAQKPIKTWSVSFPQKIDYNAHSTEILIDELPLGHYILIASADEKFKSSKAYQYASINSTDLAYISKKKSNEGIQFFVSDRETGVPQKNVIADVFVQRYDYKKRKYISEKKASFITDKNGSFFVKQVIVSNRNNNSFYLVFTKDEDVLSNKDYYSLYNYHNSPERTYIQTTFFTDRAIYRPGQTVHFKGIVLSRKGKENKIKTDYKTTVEFLDVNWQKIAEVKVSTNEFGSFSGSFVAPDDRLNGVMHLREKNGQHSISVEEYKRPNFELSMKPITGTYKLNELVTVDGEAKTYSGAPLDAAKVSYRVVRNGQFPFWCWYRWGYMPSSPNVEITNGTTKTKDDGSFSISFKALADKNVNEKFSPTYNYTVYVDITDVNGETHSTQTTVRVSETSLVLSSNLEGSFLKETLEKIDINSTNLNGTFEPANVSVEVWSLEAPKQYYVERKWNSPEEHLLSKNDFQNYFPLENYADEHLVQNWKRKLKVVNEVVNTKDKKSIAIENTKAWKQGSYFIQLKAKDKFGKEVVEEKYFRIIDRKSKKADPSVFFELTDIKTTCEPGEKAQFLISTAAENVKVYYEIERHHDKDKATWLNLSNEQKVISIPVTENDRGNFTIHIAFVKHNRSYVYTKPINVPYTNKKLDIEFSTFRDKLLPGQQEEWQLKIKGPKGEKIAAEMLAGMYDASLDAFRSNAWNMNIWSQYYSDVSWQHHTNFGTKSGHYLINDWNTYTPMPSLSHARLNQFGYYYNGGRRYGFYGADMLEESVAISSTKAPRRNMKKAMTMDADMAPEQEAMALDDGDGDRMLAGNNKTSSNEKSEENQQKADFGDIKARKNFNETAFFKPHLRTDENGNINIKFTIPESLTKWKLMTLAHSTDLKTAVATKEIITQKDLMVYPNAPRFFRENDEMVFRTKIVSLSKEALNGEAKIIFYNALTQKDITQELLKENATQSFQLAAEKSTSVAWNIKIPESYYAITYKVLAKAGNFSDGEEKPVPVLTNRMLVTETMPLPIRGNQSKQFRFNKLADNTSTTLKHHKLTLEFTSNPAWYAIQALPYLMEYPHQCAEQTFSRYYANAIATHIANSSPKIKAVFKSWENTSPEAFLSNLEKNQELKSVILEETPWVLQAKGESERKKRVGLLFNLNKMSKQLNKALSRLQKMQKVNGGWPWFEGMPESRYITQHVACGMGHLDKLDIKTVRQDAKTWQMVQRAIRFLDNELVADYKRLKRIKDVDLSKDHIGSIQIQYLYMRSFFLDVPVQNKEVYNYYFEQAKKYWTNKSQYMQAMIALAMNRSKETQTAKDILASIKEYSIENEEMGMYWKQNAGYYWYQAPIETQALFIEAFAEITEDTKSVEAMKVWLLKQKQTQDWKTTKATTEACYALLLQGNDWLSSDEMVEIQVGNEIIDAKNNPDIKVEVGTGYFKTSWESEEIKPEMATVSLSKKDAGVSWGAMYWQYFEQLDKITPAKTPLSLEKKLFIVRNTAKGEVIEPISETTKLKLGDKVRVRIVLRSDRNMEYVHLKDMRASGFEPVNVFSGYRYQDGLGYYETTKDAATNFFISWLAKGTYVFEYDLRANIEGNFSNGTSSIQCMYAPEFASHSEGVRVQIEE